LDKGWAASRAGLDEVKKGNILHSTRTRIPTLQPSSPYPVAIATALSGLPLRYYLKRIRTVSSYIYLILSSHNDPVIWLIIVKK
jgi:hypothetical protein